MGFGAWLLVAIAVVVGLWVSFTWRAACEPLARRGPLRRLQRRDGLLLAAAGLVLLLGGIAVVRPGATGWSGRVKLHYWDYYHYFINARYFAELGYTGLYECAVVADLQDGQGGDLERRTVRDLRTDRVLSAQAAVAPDRCLRRFSPQRWRSFKRDVGWFRARMAPGRWAKMHNDHGFNCTPVWLLVGRALTSLRPATTGWLWLLMLVDWALLAVMWVVAFRTFGWRAGLVAFVFWATNYTAALGWTSWAFLRQGWLMLTVLGISLMRQQRHGLAGCALTWAALLRLIPGLLLAGPAVNGARRIWQQRRLTLSPGHRRLLLGAAGTLVVLVGLSVAVNGPAAWPAFWRKIQIHAETTLATAPGLRTLAAYDAQQRKLLKQNRRDSLEALWAARRQTFERRRPTFLALVGVFVLLLARAVWGREDWEAAVLSTGLTVIVFQPNNYYISIFLGYCLLHDRSPGTAAALCTYAALGWLTVLLIPDLELLYLWLSTETVLLVLGITARHAIGSLSKPS